MKNLNPSDNEVQTMIKLGITNRQATVYLWLAKSGTSSIKTISKGTKIARQHIYKITDSLTELGLVEKVLTVPAKFKATPIETGICILMENKNNEFTRLKTETTNLIESVKNQSKKTQLHEEKPHFVVVSGKSLTLSKIKDRMQNCEETIKGVGPWIGLQKAVFANYENIKKSLDKGVEIRHIIDWPPEKNLFKSNIKELLEHPSFSVRCVEPPVPAIIFLCDKKEAVISQSVSHPEETPDLWVTNPHLIMILEGYFEMLWNKATELKEIKQVDKKS